MLIEKNTEIGSFRMQDSSITADNIPASLDVAFFSSAVGQSALKGNTIPQSATPPLLADVSDVLNNSRERLARRFKAVSSNKKPNELRKLPLEFSQTLLTSQLLVKSLGKTTQFIDKISNLQ